MKIDITINIDDNYMQHAMAMLCSLYSNNKENRICVHVLSNKLSPKSKEYLVDLTLSYNNKILFYNVDESKLYGVKFRKERPLSMAAYYRLLLADLLPSDLEKVIYLDCDLIVLGDLGHLMQLDLTGYALAATLDDFPLSSQHRLQLNMEAHQKTFCSGVMLVNLDYWRNNNVTDALVNYAKQEKEVVYFHDQDVLNYLFKKDWFLLPPKYNRIATDTKIRKADLYRSFDYEEYYNTPIIIHYANLYTKPWLKPTSPCKKYYVQYLKKSNYNDVVFLDCSFTKACVLTLISIKYKVIIYLKKILKHYI